MTNGEIVSLTRSHLEDHKRRLVEMVEDYVRRSGDPTCHSPEDVFSFLDENAGNPDVMALLYWIPGKKEPDGFLLARILFERDEKVAYLASAYVDPKVGKQHDAIEEALIRFEAWALLRGAKTGAFHTSRLPDSHQAMTKMGWRHRVTVYEKELEHGKH